MSTSQETLQQILDFYKLHNEFLGKLIIKEYDYNIDEEVIMVMFGNDQVGEGCLFIKNDNIITSTQKYNKIIHIQDFNWTKIAKMI